MELIVGCHCATDASNGRTAPELTRGGKIWVSSALLYSVRCILRTLYNTMMRYDNENGRIREDDRSSQEEREPLDEPCAVRVCQGKYTELHVRILPCLFYYL